MIIWSANFDKSASISNKLSDNDSSSVLNSLKTSSARKKWQLLKYRSEKFINSSHLADGSPFFLLAPHRKMNFFTLPGHFTLFLSTNDENNVVALDTSVPFFFN